MAEYSLTAEALLSFGQNPPPNERALARWAAFADKVGQSILPFIIRPDRLEDVPFRALGMTPVKLSDMVPQPGEMWVLFCFKDSFREAVSSDSPLRTDGFPLVLEWRRGQPDSELLSSAFRDLAKQVRGQFGEDGKGWGLHPAFDRYGDTIAFTDPNLFSDAENSLQIASAWGALAAGLHCCIEKKFPGDWPFPSIQWDWEHKRISGVAGIADKFSVAVDCGAETVTVAAEQMKDAGRILRDLKKGKAAGKFKDLRLYAVKDLQGVVDVSDDVAWGAWRRKRRMRIALVSNILILAVGILLFMLYRNDMLKSQMRQKFLFAATELSKEDANHNSVIKAWQGIKETLELPESRAFALNEIRSRNWIVPTDIVRYTDSDIPIYRSSLYPSMSDEGFTMFWIPCGFPVDFFWINVGSWVSAEMPKGHEIWRKKGLEWCGTESLRVAPCGLAAIYEVAFPERHISAVDPFDGHDLWKRSIFGRITAFAFSNDGNRFAFATEDGDVQIWELLTGKSVTEIMRFSPMPKAVTFTDDDTQLRVRTDMGEVVCGIVVQEQESQLSFNSKLYSPREVLKLVDYLQGEFSVMEYPVGAITKDALLVSRFIAYAKSKPTNRTVDFLSKMSFGAWASALRNDEKGRQRILRFDPSDHDALLGSWDYRVNELAVSHLIRDAPVFGSDTNKLLRYLVDHLGLYRTDRQVAELEGAFLAFAGGLYPDDEVVRCRAKSFSHWTLRDGTDKRCDHKDHLVPQADMNSAAKDRWLSRCKEKSDEIERQMRDTAKLTGELNQTLVAGEVGVFTNVVDDVNSLWNAIGEYNGDGNVVMAIIALNAVARYAVLSNEVVEPLRAFIMNRQMLPEKHVGIVVGSAGNNPPKKDSPLRLGDIITKIEDTENGECKFHLMRYDKTRKRFSTLETGPISKNATWRYQAIKTYKSDK